MTMDIRKNTSHSCCKIRSYSENRHCKAIVKLNTMLLPAACLLCILSSPPEIPAQAQYTIFVFILQYFPCVFSFLFLKVQYSAICGTF